MVLCKIMDGSSVLNAGVNLQLSKLSLVEYASITVCNLMPKMALNCETSFDGVQRVLERHGSPDAKSPEKLPQTGIRDHAKIAAPYMLNSSLWLVDFPGGNGSEHYADMWKQHTALSTSAILFLDFMVRLCWLNEPEIRPSWDVMKMQFIFLVWTVILLKDSTN